MTIRFHSRIAMAAIAVSGLFVASVAAQATDYGIEVTINEAKILRLSRPATTIVIGNPEIADATVQDSTTIVLTGRDFGRTNLVILDDEGAPILDERIQVGKDDTGTLRIWRRDAFQEFSCAPTCEVAYKTAAEQADEKEAKDN
ncbi:MAG TPA: pilus assembly protein N-terminal domain-containing protein [Rhizobiaceae bacterium]|nr:pilus assembly protein N-terminal domain-containing protein [Rhizobiaceae bacterium]